MKKWTGGSLIAALAVLLLLRYSFLDSTSTSPAPAIHTQKLPWDPTVEAGATTFFPSWNKKPHLIDNLSGLADLYSAAAPNELSRATQVWPLFERILSRSDALPETANGVREAATVWKELLSAVAAEREDKERTAGLETQAANCPSSVALSETTEASGKWKLELPCGLVQDSAVTVTAVPLSGNHSGGFEMDLVASVISMEAEEPSPVVLRYAVVFGGEDAAGEVSASISQNAWTVQNGWGEEQRCPFSRSMDASCILDGLACCNQLVGRSRIAIKESVGVENENEAFAGINSSAHPSSGFPFMKEQPFSATLWVGNEGFHMTVNGRHETSFAYRERLEPWFVNRVSLTGDLELLSLMATGLPVSEDQDQIPNIQSLIAPSLLKKRLFLMVGVFSASNNFERRMALRRSWMQYEAVRSGVVAVRFFVGLHKSSQVNLRLWKEAQIYGDMQLMPFADYYSLISLKTIGICMYGTIILPAKYIMKTDDDAFVRIDEIISILKKSNSNGLLYGKISFESAPHRDPESKWYVSPEEWPYESYPPWAHGPGYIISRDIAKFIVRGHQELKLQLFKLEDVSMGIWIQEFKKTGREVQYVNDDRFHNANCESDYILAHYQGPRLMLCLWEKLLTEHEPMCCE